MAALPWGMTIDTGNVVDNELVVTVRMTKWRRRWELVKAFGRVRIEVGRGSR